MKMMESDKFAYMLQKYVKETYYSHLSDMEFAIQLSKDMGNFFMERKGMKPDQIKKAEGIFDKEVREKIPTEVIKQGENVEMLDETGFSKFAENSLNALREMNFDTCIVAGFIKGKNGEDDHLMMGSTGDGLGFKIAGERLLELEKSLRKENIGIWG